nr:AraC family transcriptional regulator [uncultured Carboxylicivirga sp.]
MKREEGFTGQRTFVIPEYILQKIKDDSLSSNLYLTDIGYYPNAEEHYRSRPKGINQFILIYCINGSGWISINSQKIRIHSNQYFIIPANTPHSYASNEHDPWTIYWIHYAGEQAAYFSDNFETAQNIIPSSIDRIEDRLQLFEEILLNLEMGYSFDNVVYANVCLMHFLASIRYLGQFRQFRKSKSKDVIESSILFMKEQIGEKMTLDELAHQANLSTSHYSMIFKKKTQQSPLDYLIQLKIQAACQLLDHSSYNIKQIANQVGYDDAYYFSRIFKKVMNISPREYRNNLKG